MASEAGKGSKQRPTDSKAYSDNWDRIFKKKSDKPVVTRGSHLTITTYPNGRVEMEWDWDALAAEISAAADGKPKPKRKKKTVESND